jgi:type I restriction enzyme, S subunit
MNLETFFEKFDQFADAPDAIGTLREVILQLAVSGRIVSQSKTDAPVDVGRLDEQAAPRKQAEGRSGASLEAVTEDEIADEIPDSWIWVRLFRLCEPDAPIVYGILQPGPDVRPNGVPYVRPTEIKDGQIRLAEIRHTSPEIAAQYARATIRKGDVLLTIVGTLGATAVVPDELDGGNITQSSCRLRPDSRLIDTSYLVICLRSRTLLSQYRGFSLGSAVQRLNIAHVRALAIPLPPLAEQKRIVAKVDELMALCDRLEAQQQERETRHAALARASLARFADAPTPANLPFLFHPSYAIPPADLRKSILTLAVQGKLVPQDPNDKPAEASSESDSLFEIPASWQWKQLRTLGLCRTGRTPPTSDPSSYGLGFPFIGPGQITPSGNITASEKTITSKGLESSTEAKALDILMVCIGGSIGKAALCREPLGFNQQINSVRLKRDLPDFVYLAVTSEYFQAQVLANASGSATPIINKGKWERISVPIPPLAEQRRIVAKVEQLMAFVEALEMQLAASRATAANLLSALVAELTARKGGDHET